MKVAGAVKLFGYPCHEYPCDVDVVEFVVLEVYVLFDEVSDFLPECD